ncbi:MAG TPA: formate dehydrogenase subunit gamma [Burkholderiaceae bacterium]|nr:formate dehydrogenase subunit gamma [Burkholderiaceae bacterium]
MSTEAVVADIIERHRERPGALLPLLHDVHDRLGHIPDAAVAPIARALNLSRAEVHGVITFYHHFRRTPGGRHTVRLCQAEACQSRGAEALAQHAQGALGCGWHETSADGAVTLEPVYCLGQCACSPALMIDDEVHARVTPARFDRLLTLLRAKDRS